jgi:hypothetical protein
LKKPALRWLFLYHGLGARIGDTAKKSPLDIGGQRLQ